MIAPSVALLALGALAVRAQQATELDLQYAQAQFIQSRIVPDMLAEFNPSAVLSVQFNSSDSPTPIGSALTIQDVVARPDITVMPAGNFSAEGAFTVAMVDPGVAGADQAPGQTRHWLVNNVYLIQGEDGNMSLNYTTDAITTYGGPYPAEGSGAHRYTILLLPQPTAFQSPADLSTPGIAISTMNFPDYIATTGLQAPVAGWYMQVEQGTSTVSAAETSAVQSSTLPAFGASSSAASMMSSGAASASASRSSTLAASGSAIQSDASVASGGQPSASASAGTSAAPGSAAFAQYAPSGALAVLAAGVFALL